MPKINFRGDYLSWDKGLIFQILRDRLAIDPCTLLEYFLPCLIDLTTVGLVVHAQLCSSGGHVRL